VGYRRREPLLRSPAQCSPPQAQILPTTTVVLPEDGAKAVLFASELGEEAMTDTQPAQPAEQQPPGSSETKWAAPQSTSSELLVSWLLIVTFILVSLVGLIWVIVDAPPARVSAP
jgi:hypothetical protein